MAETALQHLHQFTNSSSASTDTAFITAGAASTQSLVTNIVIQNNDSSAHTVTAKLQTYSSSAYATQFTKTYTVAANDSEFLADLTTVVLNGAASNADRITLAYASSLGSSDTIDCVGATVRFS